MPKTFSAFCWPFSLAGFAVLSIAAVPAEASTPIQVDYAGKDIIGQRVAHALREEISKSTIYTLSYSEEDAIFVIHLVTVKNDEYISTSYSAVLTISAGKNGGFDLFIDNIAGNCGSSRINDCASGILSSFDSDISAILSSIAQTTHGNGP